MKNFDYVVVGAGSAGCAVAARLSELDDVRVALIEAGPADTAQSIHVPAAFPSTFKSPLDWDYTTTPQDGLGGRSLYVPRGKVWGGSSSINAMIYQRGHPSCYDGWNSGNISGWGWDDVLPVFMKSEANTRGGDVFHGEDGPLAVSDARDLNPLTQAMTDAAQQVGYAFNPDFNDGEQEGFGPYQVTQSRGFRASAAQAFLHDAMLRETLTVFSGAQVQRLILEGDRCVGVLFQDASGQQELRATGEVILSAGAIGSPQLLMLSGIGPKAHLQELGIEVQHDLAGVGENLQDHFMVPVCHECTQEVTLAGAETPEQMAKLQDGRGLLTSNIGEGGGFVKLDPKAEAPELQFHFAPNYFVHDGAGNPEGHGYSMVAGTVGTKSVGRLRLASADPADKPLIDPAALEDARDMTVLVEGIKIGRKIMAAAAFDPYRGAEVLPGADVQSDADIEQYVRDYVQTIYHPVGTCKMGSDDTAVVDGELRVHGITGLRVADASIMPKIVNANTNAPAIMIGERCAEFLRAHHRGG